MDKDLLMLACVFVGMIVSLLGAGNLSSSDVNTYKLTLTKDGCSYANSVKLPIQTEDDMCAIKVRFWPNRIGSGGVIILDNDKQLAVSDSMLLVSERSYIDLPKTVELNAKAGWGLFWLVVGGLLCGIGLFIGNIKSLSGRTGSEK